jgi:hypothetical protein
LIGIWSDSQASESRHRRGGRLHAVGVDEIRALPDAFACETHRLFVVAPDELGKRGDAAIKLCERIERARAQGTARRGVAFFQRPQQDSARP